jgi:MFS family permease
MVQGFTQSSANAANLYYPRALGMTKNSTSFETAHNYEWLFSVQNAVPFLAGSTFGAGLSDPLQVSDKHSILVDLYDTQQLPIVVMYKKISVFIMLNLRQEYFYGRRGAMFIAGILTLMSVIGAAFSKTKYQLLAFRILLGLGMGAKASVVPIYAGKTLSGHFSCPDVNY